MKKREATRYLKKGGFMRLKIIAIISFLFISIHARATMFIEPSFAYNLSGTLEYKNSSGTNTRDIKGYSGTLKLGFSTAGLAIGGLVKRGKEELENDGSAAGYSWSTQYGAFIGYNLPIMLGFGVSYILPPTSHSDSSYNGVSYSTLTFGVAYSIIPFVKLQVNYGMSISPKVVVNGTANDLPYNNYTDINASAITVGLGVPIPLGF
tara:strand:- start:7873 stop:8493 length:621 start_codon:yes stop_codon:yes gene_type:complete